MSKKHYLVIMAVLLVSTALFTALVFIPNIKPYEVVAVEAVSDDAVQEEIPEEEKITIEDVLSLIEDGTQVMDIEFPNRDFPQKWEGKNVLFRYTYLGEYDEEVAEKLDEMLVDEYKWQRQFDREGNILLGGLIIKKDETYQLHTHNTFTKGEIFFLLGDLLDRFHSNNSLVGTRIDLNNQSLEAVWEEEIEVMKSSTVPYADLIISTCLERWGDRRLVSGWNLVE